MESFGTLGASFFIRLLFILIGIFIFFYLVYRVQLLIRGSKTVKYSDRIETSSEVKNLLLNALDQRARVKVRLNGRRRSFLSGLIDVGGGYILIDALFPEEGNEMIKESEFISIDFQIREKGKKTFFIPYTFDSKFVKQEIFKGFSAIRIEIPTLIQRNQKRSYYRMEPSLKNPLFISFNVQGKEVVEKIANISGGGVGFYTNLSKEVLWKGLKIDNAAFTLPGYGEIICSVIIHSFMQNDNPVLIGGKPYFNYCGAEFADIDNATRNKIIAYIIKQEREELRRMHRVE